MFLRRWEAKKTPERKVASTRDWTHNHQVVSQTSSPLSHPGDLPHKPLTLDLKQTINPLPFDKIVDLSKLKAIADNKFDVTKMIIYVFDRAENIMGQSDINSIHTVCVTMFLKQEVLKEKLKQNDYHSVYPLSKQEDHDGPISLT